MFFEAQHEISLGDQYSWMFLEISLLSKLSSRSFSSIFSRTLALGIIANVSQRLAVGLVRAFSLLDLSVKYLLDLQQPRMFLEISLLLELSSRSCSSISSLGAQ